MFFSNGIQFKTIKPLPVKNRCVCPWQLIKTWGIYKLPNCFNRVFEVLLKLEQKQGNTSLCQESIEIETAIIIVTKSVRICLPKEKIFITA